MASTPTKEKELEAAGVAPDDGIASFQDVDIDERALVWKIDVNLIPWLCLVFLLSFLDRSAIGNAKLYNLEQDLHITDKQYLLALTIFFFAYALFEVPSNIMMRWSRPSLWLSFLMVVWGVAMALQGVIHNFAGLAGLRWMLGWFEGGLYPGVVYLFSCWYKRKEVGLRLAVFFTAATTSGAFGGLLAFAISHMDGLAGIAGWRWIFIVEGLVTIVVGLISFFVLHDYPDTARFLSPAERAFAVSRLKSDLQFSAGGEMLKLRSIWQAMVDWKTWMGMLLYGAVDGPLYAFVLFSPSIINELGFTANRSNLLSIPVYIWAAFWTVGVGLAGDKYGNRGLLNTLCFGIAAAGAVILVISRNATLSYIALYIVAAGVYCIPPNTAAWIANNMEGTYKRSVSLALIVAFGNLHGAVSSNTYRAQDEPWYRFGHSFLLGYLVVGCIGSFAFRTLLRRENEKRERGERDEAIGGVEGEKPAPGGWYESIDAAKAAKGDLWSGYRYRM